MSRQRQPMFPRLFRRLQPTAIHIFRATILVLTIQDRQPLSTACCSVLVVASSSTANQGGLSISPCGQATFDLATIGGQSRLDPATSFHLARWSASPAASSTSEGRRTLCLGS